MKKNKEEILEILNEKAFKNDKYSRDDCVNELMNLQDAIMDFYRESENFDDEKLQDLIHILAERARRGGLKYDPVVKQGISSLNTIDKEIATRMKGLNTERRVEQIINNYNADDVSNFTSISLSNGITQTELDDVIVTPGGILILEVKSVSGDVFINHEGLLFVNGTSHDIRSTGQLMKEKRELLKMEIQKRLRERKRSIELPIKSKIVFAAPRDKQIRVEDQFQKEEYIFTTAIAPVIQKHREINRFDETELGIIKEILTDMQAVKREYPVPDNVKKAIPNVAALIELLSPLEKVTEKLVPEEVKTEPVIEVVKEKVKPRHIVTETNVYKRNKDTKRLILGKAIPFASILSGVACGIASIALRDNTAGNYKKLF